jgi:beta-glucanase (GH16 family)
MTLRARLVAAAALTATTALAFSALAADGSQSSSHTTIVQETVPHPGKYTVMVTVAGTAHQDAVDVAVGSQVQRGVPLGPKIGGQSLAFFVTLKSRQYSVRVTSTRARVHFNVAAESTAAAAAAPTSGPYKRLAWSDDFEGPADTPADPTKWSPEPGGGCGLNSLSTATTSLTNASLDGQGNLGITALPNPAGSGPSSYTTALLDTKDHYTFSYGRVEARVEIPVGSGLCSAFWLLATPPAGAPCTAPCPEIDIMEHVSPYPGVAFGTLHGPVPAGSPNTQQWQGHVTTAAPLAGQFHIWGLIWSPGRITWTLDGLPYATATPKSFPPGAQWVFDGAAMRVIFDLAVGGAWALPPSSLADFPATMRVDWVRIYQ